MKKIKDIVTVPSEIIINLKTFYDDYDSITALDTNTNNEILKQGIIINNIVLNNLITELIDLGQIGVVFKTGEKVQDVSITQTGDPYVITSKDYVDTQDTILETSINDNIAITQVNSDKIIGIEAAFDNTNFVSKKFSFVKTTGYPLIDGVSFENTFVDFAGKRLSNIAEPNDAGNAATKNYVDTKDIALQTQADVNTTNINTLTNAFQNVNKDWYGTISAPLGIIAENIEQNISFSQINNTYGLALTYNTGGSYFIANQNLIGQALTFRVSGTNTIAVKNAILRLYDITNATHVLLFQESVTFNSLGYVELSAQKNIMQDMKLQLRILVTSAGGSFSITKGFGSINGNLVTTVDVLYSSALINDKIISPTLGINPDLNQITTNKTDIYNMGVDIEVIDNKVGILEQAFVPDNKIVGSACYRFNSRGNPEIYSTNGEIALRISDSRINANSHKISEIAEPTDLTDATTKNYVDSKIVPVASGDTPADVVGILYLIEE